MLEGFESKKAISKGMEGLLQDRYPCSTARLRQLRKCCLQGEGTYNEASRNPDGRGKGQDYAMTAKPKIRGTVHRKGSQFEDRC